MPRKLNGQSVRLPRGLIIDATASLREVMPLWLFHSRTQALIFDRQKVSLDLKTGMRGLKISDMGHTAFTRMDQNLATYANKVISAVRCTLRLLRFSSTEQVK